MFDFIAKNGKEGLSESIFVAHNPTPGTGIDSKVAATSYSATAGIMNIYNSATVNEGSDVYIVPIGLKLTARAANTNTTSFNLVGYLDVIDRHSSGGSSITPVSTSIDTRTGYTDRTPKANIDFGELTLAAASSAKKVFQVCLANGAFAVGEAVELWFGEAPGLAAGADTVGVKVAPPVWIGRGCNLSIHEVMPGSDTADPKFEFEFIYAELGHPRFNA